MLHLLYAISASDIGEDMHEVHKLEDMSSDVGDTSFVEMLHLKATLHTPNETFLLLTDFVFMVDCQSEIMFSDKPWTLSLRG
jgi:hypothetical protein